MPLVFFVGTTCTLDAIFSLFVTATVAAFYLAMEEFGKERFGQCALWLLATGVAAGCAFLTKGFLAFALPVVAVLPWLIWERRWKAILTWPWLSPASEWLPFVVALIVIAPWGIMIHRAQPDFWRYFVVEEHFARFFGGAGKVEHPHGPFYFVLTLLWGAGEWYLLSPAIAFGFRKIGIRGENASWFRFLICWFAGPFLFLSASSGKLPTYILPCFPALAIMVSAGVFRYFEERPDGKGKLFNVPLMVFSGFLALLLVAGIAAMCLGLPGRFGISVYEKDETWKVFVLFNVIVLTLFGFVAAFTEKKAARKLSYFVAAVIPGFIGVVFIVPQHFYDARSMDKFLEECRDEITPDTIVISHGSNLHAICYAYHRNDLYVIFPGELTYGLTCKEAEEKDRIRNQGYQKVGKLMAANPGKKIVMIFPADRYFQHNANNAFPPAISVRKSIPSDPEDKHADGQVLVRFQ
jgi:4-amino-4-deoxy-L-arabinose transferase